MILDEDAEKGEVLVPIRLEFDVEHHKMKDTFVWNLNGGTFSLLWFPRRLTLVRALQILSSLQKHLHRV